MNPEQQQQQQDVLRDDKTTLTMLLDLVRTSVLEDNKQGGKSLPEDDRNFLKVKRVRIGEAGLIGGAVISGAAFLGTSRLRPWARIGTTITSWIIGSGVGRYFAVENALVDMYELPETSYLGQRTREIVNKYATKDGYFAKRYHLTFESMSSYDGFPGMPVPESNATDNFNFDSYFQQNSGNQTEQTKSFDSSFPNETVKDPYSREPPSEDPFREFSVQIPSGGDGAFPDNANTRPEQRNFNQTNEQYDSWSQFNDDDVRSPNEGKSWDQIRAEYARQH